MHGFYLIIVKSVDTVWPCYRQNTKRQVMADSSSASIDGEFSPDREFPIDLLQRPHRPRQSARGTATRMFAVGRRCVDRIETTAVVSFGGTTSTHSSMSRPASVCARRLPRIARRESFPPGRLSGLQR
jgi:hypothetical protein